MAAVGALRRLTASVMALGRIRLELLAIEVQEEKQRLATLAFWAVLSALAVGFAGVFAALTLTVWLWESHRLLALGVSTLLWVFLAVWGTTRLKALTARGSTLFQASLAELRQDEQALRAPVASGRVAVPSSAPGPGAPPTAATDPESHRARG